MGLNDLVASSLGASSKFNWTWFIEIAVCGILVLFFCFYFNRLFATIVSYFVRLYTWRAFRIWIDIQAIQISLLGGRIFFKGVRYHGENETILVHSGHITFRYWLRTVRQVDLGRWEDNIEDTKTKTSKAKSVGSSSEDSQDQDTESGFVRKPTASPARIAVSVTGVEWFVYNRTPLYDAIVRDKGRASTPGAAHTTSRFSASDLSNDDQQPRSSLRKRHSPAGSPSSEGHASHMKAEDKQDSKRDNDDTNSFRSGGDDSINSIDDDDDDEEDVEISFVQRIMIGVLPISIDCSRAAVSIGNQHTRALLVTTVQKASGHIDASSCGPHDIFRQLFDFAIEHPIVYMKPNPDFRASQMASAESLVRNVSQETSKRPWWKVQLHLGRRRRDAMHNIRNMVPWWRSSVESFHHGKHHSVGHPKSDFGEVGSSGRTWYGLGRYLDESEVDDHQAWADIEYARFSTLVDCPAVHLVFYWDAPGQVQRSHLQYTNTSTPKDINGTKAPAYGLDLTIKGGNINYGPWADRLRAEIQAIFLPSSYHSPRPATTLAVGDWRQSTSMVIRIDIEDEVTLRIPTREKSKDWRWRGRATAVRDAAALRKQRGKRHFRFRRGQKNAPGPDIRPFGWLAVSVASNSTVRYVMDMVASPTGYCNLLDLDLRDTKATSSVNHAILWQCTSQKLQCDLSNPLVWNAAHQWRFNIANESMEFYLLRDHMFLLTDLIADFTAGMKSEYLTFVPFTYSIGLRFDNLKLYLNANDFNIIDSSNDLENNAFLILGMQTLVGQVDIPMQIYSPALSSVNFKAEGSKAYLDLTTPTWNTLHTFSKDRVMATLRELSLDGSYNYHGATSAQLTDSLIMNITGRSPKFHLQGFLIRYFMNVKENYFGDHLHFRTLEEYQLAGGPDMRQDTRMNRPQGKKDNDLDVVLSVRAEESCALMPTNIYERHENLRIDVMRIVADMRFTNYYMDLQVDSSPVEVSTEIQKTSSAGVEAETSRTQLFIDKVSVYGHRLFGAPPSEPTYVCNWDFDVGKISGECSTDFLRILVLAIESFVFTLDDDENALQPTTLDVLDDITFLRARTSGICIWFTDSIAAFLVEIAPFNLDFDDWAGQHFSKQVNLEISSITLAAIELRGIHRAKDVHSAKVPTFACVQTSVRVSVKDRKAEFAKMRLLQQSHVRFHDLRTRRTRTLLRGSEDLNFAPHDIAWSEERPAMPAPIMPVVLTKGPLDESRLGERAQSRPVVRKTSFLSTSSASLSSATRRSSNSSFSQDRPNQPRAYWPRDTLATARVSQTQIQPNDDRHMAYSTQVAGTVALASPWVAPYFPLHKLRPDTTTLPDFMYSVKADEAGRGPIEDGAYAFPKESTNASTSIICELQSGLQGFLTPEVFVHLTRMVASILPQTPVDLLDTIQRDTTSSLKQTKIQRNNHINDFALRVPVMAIRLVNDFCRSSSNEKREDRYDVRLENTQLALRIMPTVVRQSDGRARQDTILSHLSLGRLTLDVGQGSDLAPISSADFHTALGNLSFWLSLQDEIRMDVKIGSLEAEMSGAHVEKLASLIQRTTEMITDIKTEFEKLDQASKIRQLVRHLALMGRNTPDPAFLGRPSYVLRSDPEHLRTNDSWKALAILRQRQLVLLPSSEVWSPKEQERNENPVLSTKREILGALSKQPTNESEEQKYRYLSRTIFGQNDGGVTPSHKVDHIQAGIFIGQASFLLDPGPQQSQVSIESCNLNFEQKPVLQNTGRGHPGQMIGSSRRAVRGWASAITIDLNWELVALAHSLIAKMEAHLSSAPPQSATDTRDSPSIAEDLTIVVGADETLLRLTTINLLISMASTQIKSSLVLEKNEKLAAVSLVLAADSAQANIESDRRKLFESRVSTPSIYASHQKEHTHSTNVGTVRVAATSTKLRLRTHEAAVGLLEVATAVVRDEVPAIRNVVALLEKPAKPNATSTPITSFPDLHLALLLNDYKLTFTLFPSLLYSISGKTARTSIVPITSSKFAVHVDVKRNHHNLSSVTSDRDVIPVLEVPPISGRLQLSLTQKGVKIKASSTIELISVEASAVQAFLDVAYQSENVEYIRCVNNAVQKLQSVLKDSESFSKLKKTKDQVQQPSSVVLYSLQMVFAGLAVNCSIPVQREIKYNTGLKFEIRDTTVRIHNIDKHQDSWFDQPQFEVNLPKVSLDLGRKINNVNRNVGKFALGLRLSGCTNVEPDGSKVQSYRILSNDLRLDLFASTPAVAVDVVAYVQERFRSFLSEPERPHVKSLKPLKSLVGVQPEPDDARDISTPHTDNPSGTETTAFLDYILFLEMNNIQARWILEENTPMSPGRRIEDLVFSIRKIDLQTQRETSARLIIIDLQLQLVPQGQNNVFERTRNSALLPEVVFKAAHLSTRKDRRFAFQAAGKALDLRLAADGVLPLSAVQKSLASARSEMRSPDESQETSVESKPATVSSILGNKRLASLLVDADFAGAILTVTPRTEVHSTTAFGILKGSKKPHNEQHVNPSRHGAAEQAVLRAPGVAMKVEFRDTGREDPTFNTEIKVAASNNTLTPSVVPLILEIYSSIKESIGESNIAQDKDSIKAPAQRYLSDANIADADPTAMLGRVKLNASLWVQRQEFSLTCQPIARVQATALFDDIFVTANTNTVQGDDENRYFSVITKFNKLRASVQHVYSRESTASFDVDSIVMSIMNSRHVNSRNGISVILTVSPMVTNINARQLQDFLLFREIWYPEEIRANSSSIPTATSTADPQAYAMQRYQELTEAAVLPWHAIVSVKELKLEVDFGPSLGKSSFTVSKLWASSKKNSDSEQNLCVGFDRVGIDSAGRMSGFIEIRSFRARTSIRWPPPTASGSRAPLIQASLGFDHLRLKTAFDYQPFAVADVSAFEFLMYNVRPDQEQESDRLVGILDGGKVQVFCIAAAAGQGLAILQAFERLFQEKKDAYHESLKENERSMRRKSTAISVTRATSSTELVKPQSKRPNHVLHTDVVVTLKAVDVGVFPNSFFDTQILKVEAADVQARFAVAKAADKIRSGLGMSLGQVRVALSSVGRTNTKALGEVEISEVIDRATSSRGGTIVKVPRLVASMQTWQQETSNTIEYVFSSTFQGKVDVGWNYSRITYIRGMWETHVKALAQRLGKPLQPTAVKITTGDTEGSGQEKITAVVNVPQSSKYEYVALQPPIIDTPQLRDMGEATPPLEWIGLHRDKLPNVTHSIVIVSLLEVAREVEDAYCRILGTG